MAELPAVRVDEKQKQKSYGPSGLSMGYPHFRTIAICVPWSGRPLPPELVMAFKACAPRMNCNTIFFETKWNEPKDIADARNQFVKVALEHGARYLFFWDEDVLLPPYALRELMFVMQNWDNIGVIGGIYCLKSDRPEPLVFKCTGESHYWDWEVGEVLEVTGISRGCTWIRADVFKDIEEPWLRTIDDMSSFFDNVPFGEVWTEDLYFCKKVVDTKKWRMVAH